MPVHGLSGAADEGRSQLVAQQREQRMVLRLREVAAAEWRSEGGDGGAVQQRGRRVRQLGGGGSSAEEAAARSQRLATAAAPLLPIALSSSLSCCSSGLLVRAAASAAACAAVRSFMVEVQQLQVGAGRAQRLDDGRHGVAALLPVADADVAGVEVRQAQRLVRHQQLSC